MFLPNDYAEVCEALKRRFQTTNHTMAMTKVMAPST